LVLLVGLAAYQLGVLLKPHTDFISDVVLGIFLGALILNTPIAGWIRMGSPYARDADSYERGLRFTGKWVLRLAIILMGLKIQTSLFNLEQVGIVCAILAFSLPTAFYLTHSAARWLGLRREMGDLLSIGTMVCGASAINALSPVVNARRRDQGLAITAVFLFSIVALLAFYPVAQWLGLSDDFGGLWAGLAVNDLSSSVAVGDQFGSDASVIAAAAKSVRIILLGPMLVVFSVMRTRAHGATSRGAKASWSAHFPKFILGYFAFFVFRLAGDAQFGGTEEWASVLWWDSFAVKILILMVCVGIGLQIRVKTIIKLGWKAVVSGACASIGGAGLSLAMLYCFANEQIALALVVGGAGVLVAGCVYFLGASEGARERSLLRTFEEKAPLSIRESSLLLDLFDRRDQLTSDKISRVLKRTYPAIGEIQPLRTTALIPPIQYRRLIYWESTKGSGSLVGILWTPGAVAHIHSHGYHGIGKTIEGQLEDTQYGRRTEDTLEVLSREVLDPEQLIEFKRGLTIHSVRNLSDRDAIHMHFYGPEEEEGLRFDPLGDVQPNDLEVGTQFKVGVGADELPQTVLSLDEGEELEA
jgi:uncharacterized integral membrane protein (TIGR00698 family)